MTPGYCAPNLHFEIPGSMLPHRPGMPASYMTGWNESGRAMAQASR
jgi:hypothetical protein